MLERLASTGHVGAVAILANTDEVDISAISTGVFGISDEVDIDG